MLPDFDLIGAVSRPGSTGGTSFRLTRPRKRVQCDRWRRREHSLVQRTISWDLISHRGRWMDTSSPDTGLYLFTVRLAQGTDTRIGALGMHHFPPGWYVYVGSARRALSRRVARHLRCPARVRWHIDHLNRIDPGAPGFAILLPGSRMTECALNRRVGAVPGFSIPVQRFGASDCREGCPAHLWYTARALAPSELEDELVTLVADRRTLVLHRP